MNELTLNHHLVKIFIYIYVADSLMNLRDYHVSVLPELCWESKISFNFFLIIPVDADKSEFFAEPGISSPFLVGTHLSNTSGDISLQISTDLDTKLCLVFCNLTRGTLSLILSFFGRNVNKFWMDIGDLNFNTLKVSINR